MQTWRVQHKARAGRSSKAEHEREGGAGGWKSVSTDGRGCARQVIPTVGTRTPRARFDCGRIYRLIAGVASGPLRPRFCQLWMVHTVCEITCHDFIFIKCWYISWETSSFIGLSLAPFANNPLRELITSAQPNSTYGQSASHGDKWFPSWSAMSPRAMSCLGVSTGRCRLSLTVCTTCVQNLSTIRTLYGTLNHRACRGLQDRAARMVLRNIVAQSSPNSSKG